jgi:transcriptional regulator GlxA family with amidase domain
MLFNPTPSSIMPPDSIAYQPHHERMLLHARPPAGLPTRLCRSIQEYIDTHLDSRLSNTELAARSGLSVSHFCRSFAQSVGTTPHNYVVRLRLSRAQQLLATTDLALTEIALTTGFADQSHFSRRFLRFAGLQPRAFRKQYRRDAASNLIFATEFLSGESK